MANDKEIPIIIKCKFVTGKAIKRSNDLNLINVSESKIYDFGSKSSFFCTISDKTDELKLLNNEISNYLFDDYIFIDICRNTYPYNIGVGISYTFLEDYFPEIFDLKDGKIEEILKKFEVEFISKFSLLSYKYLEFYKDYSKSVFKSLLLQSYCLQLICDFSGYLKGGLNDNKSMKAQSLENKKIKEILQKVMSELYKTSPTVQEMANMADMSVSKFKLIFNNEYGESPHQHILGKRLTMARELLQTGSYSVSQVCYKVGFNHPSGFTRLFKQKFQCTPSKLFFSN